MNIEPKGPYVYQPYGISDIYNNINGEQRLWGVGGVSLYTEIKGLTKEEANAIVDALERIKK